ncbi:MAG: hypothetical protein GX242_03945, partial [Clostridiales bacterium]|nr:hypothetical protein [Clostridiales bacterium]
MRKTKIINRKTLSLSTFFVLGLFALYRIILEIYYSNNFWGYDTYTERSTTFGIYMAILLIPTIILMLKVFENASFRLKFSTASIQFLLAVLIATEIFNGGSFSGNGDIRMIILNTLVTVVLILLPILFVVQLSLYENPNNSKDRIIDRTQKVSYQFNILILLIVHMCLIGLVMYFDCILRAPKPDFVKSYGKILLAYPLPFVVVF